MRRLINLRWATAVVALFAIIIIILFSLSRTCDDQDQPRINEQENSQESHTHK